MDKRTNSAPSQLVHDTGSPLGRAAPSSPTAAQPSLNPGLCQGMGGQSGHIDPYGSSPELRDGELLDRYTSQRRTRKVT